MVGASVTTRPVMMLTLVRCFGGNTSHEVANAVGIMAPPRKPCSARATIIDSMLSASAHMTLMAVKLAQDSTNTPRGENAPVREPHNRIITTPAIRDQGLTH